jgi:hypothetical protein
VAQRLPGRACLLDGIYHARNMSIRCPRNGRIAQAFLIAAITVVALLVGASARALETDQYFAWTKPLGDSSDAINAKFNLEIELTLRALDQNRGQPLPCSVVALKIKERMHFWIFQPIELWAMQSPLFERVPARAEENTYVSKSIYGQHGPLDVALWMPLAPTIEINGVRFGTDKLSHFVSSGWRYHVRYERALENGLSEMDAERTAIRFGVFEENTILGKGAIGVFSRGDLEADFGGMRFFEELCHGPDPMLVLDHGRWRRSRAFDMRRYVNPGWDESFQISIFSKARWRKVKPALLAYCGLLQSPEVRRQRAYYLSIHTPTPTDAVVTERVQQRKLEDPQQFSLEAICPAASARPSRPPPPIPSPQSNQASGDVLMDAVAAADRTRESRHYLLLAADVSYPKRVSGSLAVLFTSVPTYLDCRGVCDMRGMVAQIEPGLAGGQVSLGFARIIAQAGESERVLSRFYLAYGLKAALLRTWGDSPFDPEDQTLAGIESEFSIDRVNFRLGVFRRISNVGSKEHLIVTGGLGWGF